MQVLAVYSIKGGVGKTATAVNLAHASILDGSRTLLWDLDPQGSASFYFRVRTAAREDARRLEKKKELRSRVRATDYPGLDLVAADFAYRHLDLALSAEKRPGARLRKLVEPLAGRYERVILDCPPSISLASESVFDAADALVVPTIPTTLSLRALEQLAGHLATLGAAPRLWPFFCMVDRRKSLHRTTCAAGFGDGTEPLEANVPYASEVERMGLERRPLLAYAPRCPAAAAYLDLWREIRHRSSGMGSLR